MEFKILESNGVENENVDGAALNNAMAGGKDGILKSILNECLVHNPTSTSISVGTGVMMIQGFRVKITEPWIKVLSSSPSNDTEYQIVAKITLSSTRDVSFEIICRQKGELIKENLFKTENGVYEAEIACFKHNSSGEIVDLVKTMGFLSFFEEPTKDEVLTAPTISLDGDILTITPTDERTETFAIFVDGVEMATVANEKEPDIPDTPDTPSDDTVAVSGTWVFDETFSFLGSQSVNETVNFISNGTSYTGFASETKTLYYRQNSTNIEVYFDGSWHNQAYRTITFDGVQYASKEFYEWLVANAVQQTILIDGHYLWNYNISLFSTTKKFNVNWSSVNYPSSYGNKIEIGQSGVYLLRDFDSLLSVAGYNGILHSGYIDYLQPTSFGDTPQEVSKEFYDWLVVNAIKQ